MSNTLTLVEAFHFRTFADTPENRAKQIPAEPDHEIQLSTGMDEVKGATFKRASETYNLVVPNASALLVEGTSEQVIRVVQEQINALVKAAARRLVDAGKTITEEVLNWESIVSAEFTRLMSSGSSAKEAAFGRELLKSVADMFSKWGTDTGRKAGGVELTAKMIRARFNAMSTAQWKPIIPRVIESIELWFSTGLTEAEQEQLEPVIMYLLECAEESMKEPEQSALESMF